MGRHLQANAAYIRNPVLCTGSSLTSTQQRDVASQGWMLLVTNVTLVSQWKQNVGEEVTLAPG